MNWVADFKHEVFPDGKGLRFAGLFKWILLPLAGLAAVAGLIIFGAMMLKKRGNTSLPEDGAQLIIDDNFRLAGLPQTQGLPHAVSYGSLPPHLPVVEAENSRVKKPKSFDEKIVAVISNGLLVATALLVVFSVGAAILFKVWSLASALKWIVFPTLATVLLVFGLRVIHRLVKRLREENEQNRFDSPEFAAHLAQPPAVFEDADFYFFPALEPPRPFTETLHQAALNIDLDFTDLDSMDFSDLDLDEFDLDDIDFDQLDLSEFDFLDLEVGTTC